jgi:hypothetical protein
MRLNKVYKNRSTIHIKHKKEVKIREIIMLEKSKGGMYYD